MLSNGLEIEYRLLWKEKIAGLLALQQFSGRVTTDFAAVQAELESRRTQHNYYDLQIQARAASEEAWPVEGCLPPIRDAPVMPALVHAGPFPHLPTAYETVRDNLHHGPFCDRSPVDPCECGKNLARAALDRLQAEVVKLRADRNQYRETALMAIRLKLRAQQESDRLRAELSVYQDQYRLAKETLAETEAELVVELTEHAADLNLAADQRDQAFKTRDLAQAASTLELEARRSASIPWYLEQRVAAWVISRIGANHMHSRERAMRLLEEAVELVQAEGIDLTSTLRQVLHVYARPDGDPTQEAAGVAVCLLGWCAATNNRLLDLALAEVERIEAKPLDQIRGSLARKADADLFTIPMEHGGGKDAS